MRLDNSKSFISNSLGIIANGLGKKNALAKAAFAAEKAIAISEMIVSTESAATQALSAGGPYGGPVLAGIIRGLGYASVGIVAGQAIASFEGGGFTGTGPRSGGLDGKGGKFAVLHPNEKVIDMQNQAANDGGWQVNVYNNAGASVTQDIDIHQKIISVMVDQASKNTSPFMNAIQKNTTARPRGTR